MGEGASKAGSQGEARGRAPAIGPPAPETDSIQVEICALCGGRERKLMFEAPPHSVVRCASCGLVWVTPRLTERGLRQVYAEGYWSSDSPKTRGYSDYRRDEPLYLKTFRKRFSFVSRHLGRPGRLLDVGCAAGFFMKVAEERGWEVNGVELSAEIAQHAVNRFGFKGIHVGTLDTAPHAKGSFDLVTMWDVVEHVPDPRALLARARELLKPGGALVLETQNVDSSFARLLGPRWQHYKHDEHLYHFSPPTMRRLLAGAGFDLVELTPRLGGKYVSFGFIAERAARLHPAMSALLSPLSLMKRANVYVNLRDEMIVVARPSAAGSPVLPS
jgi:SAM-dependent methyltransferase